MSGLIAGLQEFIGKKIFRHEVEIDKTLLTKGAATFKKGADLSPYDTGWINRSDWTNVHLGSDTTLNTDSDVNHRLNAPLPSLLVKVYISTDGTDANSFELGMDMFGGNGVYYGYTIYEVDNYNTKIQTAEEGLLNFNDSGTPVPIDTEDWYYRIKVYFLG